jgi:DNA polymerase/3'-5' exonuclease PolX
MNNLIISYLKKLEDQAKINQEVYRERAFKKAKNKIARLDFEITDVNQLKGMSGFGKGIIRRIEEILENKSLSEIDEEVIDEKHLIIDEFLKINGVGVKTAEKWYDMGYRSIKDILKKVKLTHAQEIGIKYLNELNERIPRKNIDHINDILQNTAKEINKKYKINLQCVIAGSYRRKLRESGDIDCLVSEVNNKLTDKVIDYFIKRLKELELITDDLGRGESKYSAICKDNEGIHRRIDFEFVRNYSCYPYEILYFTGGQQLNLDMRSLAKEKGMMLNQNGLYKNHKLITAKDEKEIFKHLGMKYLPPDQRY